MGTIQVRYEGHSQVTRHFECLNVRFLSTSDSETIRKSALELVRAFQMHKGFVEDVLNFRNYYIADSDNELGSVTSMLKFVVENNIHHEYSHLMSALKLFLTIPVTVGTAERSFSKLKLIKSYLRSTMSQERLHSLAILSIESKTSMDEQTLDPKSIARNFLESGKWQS